MFVGSACCFCHLVTFSVGWCLMEIGVQDQVLEWFQSNLSDRMRAVTIKELVYEPHVVKYGVPRISVWTYVIQRVLSSAYRMN